VHDVADPRDPDNISSAFIDVDEWRDEPRRHRYVHGGFEGTDTRFSIYFPEPEHYRGRFFQFLEGGAGGHENTIVTGYAGAMAFEWFFDLGEELGGYLVESNQGHFTGHGLGFGNDYELWGASAQSALYGKQLAKEMYGERDQVFGYVWGGSGGGARSGHCLENRPDVWQGGVPHMGIGQSTQWSPWALTWLHAREKFPQIIDAVEPGGSGNPFETLSHVQRTALADLYRRGWPRGADTQLAPFTAWAFTMYATAAHDEQYFTDFWTKPGYLGHDDPASLKRVLIKERATVTSVIPASEVDSLMAQMHVRMATAGAVNADPMWGARLDIQDPDRIFMANIKILSGKAAGRELLVSDTAGGVISPFNEMTPEVWEGVQPGDEVEIDNTRFVAWCHYHWYTVQDPSTGELFDSCLSPWAIDGNPIHPQRGIPPVSEAAPTRYKRTISNKMIYVQATHDAQVWPTTVFPYVEELSRNLGAKLNDHFRLWFVENAPHGAPMFLGPALTREKDPGIWDSRMVPYDAVTAQALRDVVGWVEDGIEPATYTGYHLTADNGLVLPASAAERGGVQPVVTAQANGSRRAEVKVGEAVTFAGTGEQPPGMGSIVSGAWDFEGRGQWQPVTEPVDGGSSTLSATAAHTYTAPGTYFASFRVGAHRDGAKGRGQAVTNLYRVRVVATS
jgi:hypothetical protein